eukprot:CAMPEP_0184020654 /NCGR_PEP_ID=MMETSP0954-20121128/9476_1 /TAXON_ID=627963 /ORGANISM="Aplanochytrium sp, Strain PBS07" /LENGTH=253 /DNA_ID=CAMNT_0026302553 /DNA_START=327 /DNA_END=1088 /DNA_ORIENTATION=+
MLSQPGLSRSEIISPVNGRQHSDNLLSYAAHYLRIKYNKTGNVFVSVANRLDRPVSGLVVCAKTSKAASRLAQEFSARRVSKEYIAVVDGELVGDGVVEAGITSYDGYWKQRGGVKYLRASSIGNSKRKEKLDGELKYTALQYHMMPDGSFKTLVGIKTKTGYKHQIRRQMAYLGHPITGDTLYGKNNTEEARELFPHQDKICLHASFLRIRHPVGKRKPVSFVASLSKRFFPWMDLDLPHLSSGSLFQQRKV